MNSLTKNINQNEIIFKTDDGSKVHFSIGDLKYSFNYFWLRDHCRCTKCYNYTTFQRSIHILDIPENIRPLNIQTSDGRLQIKWEGGHHSTYSSEFFLKNNHQTWLSQQECEVKHWRGNDIEDKVAKVSRDRYLECEQTLKVFLRSLVLYGVGFVDDVEPTEEDTERVIRRLAPPQTTLFGGMWSVTTDPLYRDTAYSTLALACHTDSTYFTESTGLQVFHCLEDNCVGGESVLVDGFQAVKSLADKYPKDVNLLSTKVITSEYLEEGQKHKYTGEIIRYNKITGDLEQIRYNVYDRTPFTSLPEDETLEYYKALRHLAQEIENPYGKWSFKLKPGRVLFFDNWRVLHGRSAFTGKRYLSGSYISRSDWLSRARTFGLIG